MVAKKKPGPHPEHPKDTTIRARVDQRTIYELDKSVKELNVTRSDIIREGIRKIYEGLGK